MQNPQSKSRELQMKVQNHQQTPDYQLARNVFQKTDAEKARLKELKREYENQPKKLS